MLLSFASRIASINADRVIFRNGNSISVPAGSPFAEAIEFADRAHRPLLVKRAPDGQVIFAGPAWISGVARTTGTEAGLVVYLRGRSSGLLLPSGHDNFPQLAGLFVAAEGDNRVLAVAQELDRRIVTDAIPSRTERLSGERNALVRQPPRAKVKSTTEEALAHALSTFWRQCCAPTKAGVEDGSTCIPFNYPEEGCQGRAAYMCAELHQLGIDSGKIWCFPAPDSRLVVPTKNAPCGEASWIQHVAALVRVGNVTIVIDPSVPGESPTLSIADWQKLIGAGDGSTTIETTRHVFGLDILNGGSLWRVHYDSHGARAVLELAAARAALSISAKAFGEPPYYRALYPCP